MRTRAETAGSSSLWATRSPWIEMALAGLLLGARPGFAQVLIVEPGCGKPGDTMQIGGSGWAEPSPVCEYLFYFDDSEFAERQPDGLYGPPARTVPVPNVPPGDHEVRVELRLTDGTLLQCRETIFKVVEAILDPFKNNLSPAVGGTDAGGKVDLTFDPKDVCNVTPCTRLAWIQTLKQVGVKADGTEQTLTYADFGFPNAENYDKDTVPSTGVGIDRIWGRPYPYYGSNDRGNSPTSGTNRSGVQSGTPRSANMVDVPGETSFPKDSERIRFEFEANVFCAEGQNKGEFPGGKVVWKWEKNKGTAGRTGTATLVSAGRGQPSAAFLGALARWDTNHATWEMPKPSPPTAGGGPCDG